MSKDEVTRTLPPVEPKEINPEKLTELLRSAFHKCVEILSDEEPSNWFERPIYRPVENASRAETMSIPVYLLQSRRKGEVLLSNEIKGLFDYIWRHGKMKVTLKGPASEKKLGPNRKSWEEHVFQEIIRIPLSNILSRAAVDEAVATGEVTPWRLPKRGIHKIAEEVTWRISNKRYRYTARCLLAMVEGEPGKMWNLGNGIRLYHPTREERHKYLSRNSRNLPLHNNAWTASDIPILEITLSVSQRQIEEGPMQTIEDIVSRQASDVIDLVKWALMVATGQKSPLVEGDVFFECYSGGILSTMIHRHHLKRQDIRSHTVYRKVSEEDLDIVRELLEYTPRVREESEHVNGALWHFGRSCLAQLRRDALLEAVIGIEHLLTSGRSSSYQFRLYGAALMASSGIEAENIANDLKEIYGERSAAVHSHQEQANLSQKAQKLLAKAIYSVMKLVRDGELLPAQQSIPEEIQKRVLREAPFRK